MAGELIEIPADACSNVELDTIVSRARPFEGVVVDFMGDSFEDSYYVRTRISDLYESKQGLFGYIMISRTGKKGSEDEWGHMGGAIEVPGSLIEKLRERDQKLAETFAKDFGVFILSPSDTNISPFFGIDLPEDTYYWCAHPSAHNIPKDKENFIKRYQTDIKIVTGYLSKMDQWIEHANAGVFGKQKIIYDGLALKVGNRRYRPDALEQSQAKLKLLK